MDSIAQSKAAKATAGVKVPKIACYFSHAARDCQGDRPCVRVRGDLRFVSAVWSRGPFGTQELVTQPKISLRFVMVVANPKETHSCACHLAGRLERLGEKNKSRSCTPVAVITARTSQNGCYLHCRSRSQQGPRGLHRQGRQHQLHDGVAAPRQQVSSSPVFRDSHPFPDFRGFLLPGRAANLRRSHRSERSRPRRLARFVLSPRLAKIYTRSSASAMSRASSLPQRDSDCDPAGRRLGCGLTWQS